MQSEFSHFRVSSESIQKFTPAPFVANMRYDPPHPDANSVEGKVAKPSVDASSQDRCNGNDCPRPLESLGWFNSCKTLLIAGINTGKKPGVSAAHVYSVSSAAVTDMLCKVTLAAHLALFSPLLMCLLKTGRHMYFQYIDYCGHKWTILSGP